MKQIRYAHALSIALLTSLPVFGQAQVIDQADGTVPVLDSDQDGLPDNIDLDDDADGILDNEIDIDDDNDVPDDEESTDTGDDGGSSGSDPSSGGTDPSSSSGSDNSSSGGGDLADGSADGSGLGEDTGVSNITICDSRDDETGRQISISYAGSVITRRYSGCND